MRLLVEYTSHGRGPAAPQTYSTTLDIVDDVAERLLKAKTPYTFRERKRCTREALILAFLITTSRTCRNGASETTTRF